MSTGDPYSAEDWARYLSGTLGRPVRVRFGRARRQVIVVFPERAGLRVRMNQVFGGAPAEVRAAVAEWLRSGRRARRACTRLDQWIASIVPSLGPPRSIQLVARGRHHDLSEIHADLLAREFAGLDRERHPRGVTWGRRGPRSTRHSLQLGSFDPETAIVRVHPVLDQPAVPRSFVRYVLFHELLHSELNEACGSNKRSLHHGPEFRRREAEYPGTAEALLWQERHLSALIRSARSGRPLTLPRMKRAARMVQELLFG